MVIGLNGHQSGDLYMKKEMNKGLKLCSKCRHYFNPIDLVRHGNYKFCKECDEKYKVYKVRKSDYIEI